MGGPDDAANIVELTPEEHYVAHQLLVKMHPDVDALVFAANKMTVSSSRVKRNNKRYGWLKRKYQEVCKKRTGKKNPSYGRQWFHNPITNESGKFLELEIPAGWEKGRTSKTKPRFCKVCNIQVDVAPRRLSPIVFCSDCKKKKRKENTTEIHAYDLISQVYVEHKRTNIGYYTLAKKYGINKWTIYNYIERYKERLEKEYGV
jgi:hypothetical protein